MRYGFLALAAIFVFIGDAHASECQVYEIKSISDLEKNNRVEICRTESAQGASVTTIESTKNNRRAISIPVNNEKEGESAKTRADQKANAAENIDRPDSPSGFVQRPDENPSRHVSPYTANNQSKENECDTSKLSYAERLACKDLEAQEVMAKGTAEMSNAATDTVLISGGALILLFGSFVAACFAVHHTKRTADAAESAERAYLAVEPHAEIDKEDRSRFKFYISVKNYGNTPARNIQGALIFQSDSSIYGATKLHVGLPKIIKANGEFVIDSTRIDGTIKDYIGEDNKAYTKESPRSLVAGLYEITYQDVFDEERKVAISDGFSLKFYFTGWDSSWRVWQGHPVEIIDEIELDAASQSSKWIAENIKRIQINYWRPPDKKA